MDPKEVRPGNSKPGNSPAVSLFLRWFLLRSTLERNKEIRCLLDDRDEGKVVDELEWAGSLRNGLLRKAFRLLDSLLGRPMNQAELIYLAEKVEEFVRSYARGSESQSRSKSGKSVCFVEGQDHYRKGEVK
jgi:hypothetical protein